MESKENIKSNEKLELYNIYNVKIESEDYIELIEERSLNSNEDLEIHNIYNVKIESKDNNEPIEVCSQILLDALVISQTFGSWDKLDHFISSYAKSQNFVSVICESEYKDGICQNHRYACEYQGHSGTSKTNIAKNQQQTQSKYMGCYWKVHASCPKMTEELKSLL
ncbi:15106_t:CDS:2, partial [Gigaspora margarita]